MNESSPLTPIISLDISESVIGTILGEGDCRQVYEYIPNKNYVIKIARFDNTFENGNTNHNIMEYYFWKKCPPIMRKYFAPITWISKSGWALLQQRVTLFSEQETTIVTLPDFTDMKIENIGLLNGSPVIIDFGTPNLNIKLKEYNQPNYKPIMKTYSYSNGRLLCV